MIPNANLRHKVRRALNTDEVAEPNTFAVVSTIAAFEKGENWLDELRQYISENRKIVGKYLQKNIPDLHLIKGDATYLLWIDARDVIQNRDENTEQKNLAKYIREKTGLYLSDGAAYGTDGFLRMNIACPRSMLEVGLSRLEAGVKRYLKENL